MVSVIRSYGTAMQGRTGENTGYGPTMHGLGRASALAAGVGFVPPEPFRSRVGHPDAICGRSEIPLDMLQQHANLLLFTYCSNM